MNEQNDFALVTKSSGEVEKTQLGTKRIMSGIVADTIALANQTRPFRIIHHDDEDWLLEMIAMAITQKFKNVVLVQFRNGDETWQELLRADPDLLITDLTNIGFTSRTSHIAPNEICGMSGFDLLSLLEQTQVRYPILVASGMIENGREPRNMRLAQEYWPHLNISFLKKPFSLDQFYEELAKQVDRGVRYGDRQSIAKDEADEMRRTTEQIYEKAVERQWQRLSEYRAMSELERGQYYSAAEIITLLSMLRRE